MRAKSIQFIDSSNFDTTFLKLLKRKKANNVATSRFDLEAMEIQGKITFLYNLISSFNPFTGLTYKILFWENNETIREFLNHNFTKDIIQNKTPYKNGRLPGIVYINTKKINTSSIKALLNNHFNYEIAKSPSLNIRIQICINHENLVVLLDIYDDRGFDMYCLNKK